MRNHIKEKVDDIFNELRNAVVFSPGLLGGNAGIALFLAYYHRLSKNHESYNLLVNHLNQAFANSNIQGSLHLADGVGGLVWLTNHLSNNFLINNDNSELFSQIEKPLYDQMMEDALCGNFDLFYGAIGIALFFLSRKQFVFQRDYIEDLLRLINSKAIYDSDTARWPAFDIEKSAVNKAEFNLGFAHGIPSILMFIIKCSEKGFRINASKELVCKGINFLLSFENVQGSRSNFPGLVDFDEPDKHSKYSRLGWCYGDLTIGYTILKAGQHFGKHELKKKGIAILLECAKRKDLSRNYVNDAGFCHGTVGIAQVFYRANLLCPNTDLLEAQNYWTSKTLEQARYMDGMAGYKFFYNEKLIKNTSLIEGIAGVGLFLLSQTSNQPHNWDECFLLS